MVDQSQQYPLCMLPQRSPLPIPATLDRIRANAILVNWKKWANGTNLHFYFIPGQQDSEEQRAIVRWAFEFWKRQNIGLTFTEVSEPTSAEIRIRFNFPGQSNSWVGASPSISFLL